jgi:tetratricopeptide (TPR) repeat protein
MWESVMFDDRCELLIGLAWRALFASPLLGIAWYLFATTAGDADGGGKRLLGLMCVVGAAAIVGRGLPGLIAEPAGSLFYPRRVMLPGPVYSVAEARRARGKYEDALAEYERIIEQFPAELLAYVTMMEIAFVHLGDAERAESIVKRGLAALPDDGSRHSLLQKYRVIKSRMPDPHPPGRPEVG